MAIQVRNELFNAFLFDRSAIRRFLNDMIHRNPILLYVIQTTPQKKSTPGWFTIIFFPTVAQNQG